MPACKFYLGTPPRASSPPPFRGDSDEASFAAASLLEAAVSGTGGTTLRRDTSTRHLGGMLMEFLVEESETGGTGGAHPVKTGFTAPPSPPADVRSRTLDERHQQRSTDGNGGGSDCGADAAAADCGPRDTLPARVSVAKSGNAKADGQAAIKAMLNNHKNFWSTGDSADNDDGESGPADGETFEAFTKRKIWETGPNYGNLWESDIADIRHWR